MTESVGHPSRVPILIAGILFVVGAGVLSFGFVPFLDCPTLDWFIEFSGITPMEPEWVKGHPEAIREAHRTCSLCGGRMKVTWWAKWRARVHLEESLKRQGSPF
jgi:hypothetical protein